jgi:DnaJ-like protein
VATRKTLYEVLEVAQSASPETIDAAYKTLSARLRARDPRDPEGAAVFRMALEDAYRTLSSEQLRKRYDARIAPGHFQPFPELAFDERPWITRHAAMLLVLGILALAGYGYHSHVKKEQAAVAKALQEKEELLAQQKAAREASERREAEAQDLRNKRIDEAKYYQWVDQTRREAASNSRNLDMQKARIEQDAARQQRMEEMAKQREEAQARARLEQDKRRLQQLEQQNYGFRRY